MRINCLGCEVLARPLYLCASRSPHIIDITLLERGLHEKSSDLRERLQQEIDASPSEKYQAVVLAYGLCGQAISGLVARQIPVVIPHAHDCITLFLGSRQRYQEQFETYPGTFWYSHDYIERSDGTRSSLSLGSGVDTELEKVYDEYVSKYGKDNADYLMEVMGAWQKHYQRAVFIEMGIGEAGEVEATARVEAQRRGWSFERMNGDLILLKNLLEADWNTNFLVLQPGEQVQATYDDCILGNLKTKI